MSARHDRRAAAWAVRGGAVTGTGHLRGGGGCEDAYAVGQSGQLLVIAVADGCGSARFAAAGAALAAPLGVRLALESAGSAPPPDSGPGWYEFLGVLLGRVIEEFHAAAGAMVPALGGEQPADLASTLLITVVLRPWVAVLSIGDGSVVVRSGGSNLDLLIPPDTLLGDTNRTTFVTSPKAAEQARQLVGRIPDLDGVAVCSDGLDEIVVEFAGREPLRPAADVLQPLFRWADDRASNEIELLRVLVGSKFANLTEDDRTMVLAVPAA